MRILTETEIAAPADRVWGVLTDFASYPQWNPMLVHMEGDAVVGGTLRFRAKLGPLRVPLNAEVVVAEPGRELRWIGLAQHGLRRVVSGEHYFLIDPISNNRCRLTHGEEFRGWLIPNSTRIADALKPQYENLNRAIRERSERAFS